MTPRSGAKARVVLATRIFTPDRAAAAYRLQALVDALGERAAQVTVLTSRSRTDTVVFGPGGPTMHRWPVLRDRDGYVRGYLPYLSFDLPLVLRLLATRVPDVVVVEPPPTTGAVVRLVTTLRSALTGELMPYVYYAADVWSDAAESTGAPAPVVAALRAVEGWALQGAADVIAVTDGVADRVRALGAARVHVVPNGIDTTIFEPHDSHPDHTRTSPEARGIPQTPFLLYAGTASEWQGAEVFAEAMATVLEQLPDARLVFLGQGSSWPVLQRIAGQLPEGAIELRPLAPPVAAAAWLRGAAAGLVSVRPGIGYDFAYPTKVLAALGCGTPVVYAGPGPAVADLTEHGLGEAVPHDVDAAAAAMIRALRAEPDEEAAERRVAWVQQHRSLRATGTAAAEVVLRARRR
ncbi:MAG: glycosyltransferase [Ornithinimicrobium sp.]|uniref:glycosyltransferase n=1 Tax=Ornithinimicrobium sp. TaxID=1977084 RepID=UPI003D9BB53A